MSPLSGAKGALMAVPLGILAHIIVKPLQDPPDQTHEN